MYFIQCILVHCINQIGYNELSGYNEELNFLTLFKDSRHAVPSFELFTGDIPPQGAYYRTQSTAKPHNVSQRGG